LGRQENQQSGSARFLGIPTFVFFVAFVAKNVFVIFVAPR